MQGQPTLSIVLDRRRKLNAGGFPVKLQATFRVLKGKGVRWVQRYYATGVAVDVRSFEAIMGKPRSDEHRETRRQLDRILRRAEGILKNNDFVSVDLFDRLFTGESGYTVGSLFSRYIEELVKAGQVGTAAIYRTALGSFKEFAGSDVSFQEITIDWLKRYERWRQSHKVTRKIKGELVEVEIAATTTSISICLRALRKIYNDAVADKIIGADYYPFGRRQFVIRSEVKRKHALSEDQRDKVLAYRGPEQEAVDYWIFSFLCAGMNFSDLCQLKFQDIQDDVIYLKRTKTIRTARVVKVIEIPLLPLAKEIILRRGNKSLAPTHFIFPVLEAGLSPKQVRYRIQKFTDRTNQGLRRVAGQLDFKFKFTTYTARHSFATLLRLKGAPDSMIQLLLGHSTIRTTENYFGGFDLETVRRMNERLLPASAG